MRYRHVQWGWSWLLYLVFAIVMGGVMLASVVAAGDTSDPAWVIALTVALLIALFFTVLWFSRLEVTVDEETVTAAFGTGKPHRVHRLDEISAVRRERNQWWYGWGVRKVPRGWMYNVWGLDAVEIELPEDKVFRIGTNDAGTVEAVLALSTSS